MKRISRSLLAAATAASLCLARPVAAQSLIFSVGEKADSILMPAGSGDVVALDDLNISVTVPRKDGASGYVDIEQEDGFVYIHTMEAASLPYVIIGQYDYSGDISDFADMFSDYMRKNYGDLDTDSVEEGVALGGKSFVRVVYHYGIQGYMATDTRLFCSMMNRVYMFGSKEVPAISYECEAGFLDAVAASASGLAGGYSDYALHVDADTSITGQAVQAAGVGDAAEAEESAGSVGGTVGAIGDTGEALQRIDFSEDFVDFSGTWVQFADGFKLYLPSSWNEITLSDAQRQQGTLYLARDMSGAADAPYIRVAYTQSGGLSTTAEISAQLESAGYTTDAIYSFGGIEGVLYSSEKENVTGIMFFHPSTTDYIFAIVGAPSDANAELIAGVLCSLTPTA